MGTVKARLRHDGKLVMVLEDGTEVEPAFIPPSRPMTDAEIEEAARNDPDCPPLTEADFTRMKLKRPKRP